MTRCYATMAEYLRLGIEVGVIGFDGAHSWASATVDALAAPPGELIDVAWSKGLPEILTNLRLVPGSRDTTLAGQWLLGSLRSCSASSDDRLEQAVRLALQICTAAGFDEATFYRFDLIDDQLSLARAGAYGNVADCRDAFVEALAKYPNLPEELGAAPISVPGWRSILSGGPQ